MSTTATRYPWAKMHALIQRIDAEFGPQFDSLSTRREWAGSYRRNRPTIGDLDLVIEPREGVHPDDFNPLISDLTEGLLSADGDTIKRGKLRRSGIALDITFARPPKRDLVHHIQGSFGICLLTRTGPLDFNRFLCTAAAKSGLRYAPFVGLFRRSDSTLVSAENEAEILTSLGLPWIPPQARDSYV